MPFTAEQLIEGRSRPVTITVIDSVQKALDLMIEHNFSQLPVVDELGLPIGMVTSDSLLRALNNFGVTTSELPVSAAMVKADTVLPDEDLFDLLDRLYDTYAILVVDSEGQLIGIVTSYDITSYFRRRAEDMMILEDIEGALKDHIMASFFDRETGEAKRADYEAALREAGSLSRASRGRFQNAVRRYLELSGVTIATLNRDWLDEAFSLLSDNDSPNSIDDLTLNQYIDLFLHKGRWTQYGSSIFGIRPDAIRRLLNDVKDIRNALAHFRGEVSLRQRSQLRFCKDWLNRHPADFPIAAILRRSEKPVENEEVRQRPDSTLVAPQDEALGPNDSRYAPLALWLQSQPISQDRVTLTFEEIEGIINNTLPASARQHRAWWANDSVGHVQSQQWLEVGWRVAIINMTEERVTFARMKEREKAYIDYFNALLPALHDAAHYPPKERFPDGRSWVIVRWLPEDKRQILLAYSFARGRRFRVELYIDVGDQVKNKQIFDELQSRRSEIEAAVGEALSWERMDERRASRIALYKDGAITDEPEQLSQLRAWAVDAMIRFYDAIAKPVSDALKAVR